MNNIATHNAPAWGPKSDFIIRAELDKYDMPGRLEQLWASRIKESHFMICCIPFFTYGIALGDEVECNRDHTIQKVTSKSGHKTLRIAVADKDKQHALHETLHNWAENLGLLYEWHAPGYLAVDIPPDCQTTIDMACLDKLSQNGEISIEIDE